MRIINIETKFPSINEFESTYSQIFSNDTLIDAEIIFWDIEKSDASLPGNYPFASKIESEVLTNFKNLINIKKKQFDEFFKMGRTLVLPSPVFRIHQYEHQISIHNLDWTLSFLDCLPIPIQEVEIINGKSFSAINNEVLDRLVTRLKNNISYKFRYTNFSGYPLLYIKDTNYVVAQFFKVHNGLIICLPYLNDISGNKDLCLSFYKILVELIKTLHSYQPERKIEYQKWVEEYEMYGEKEDKKELKALLDKFDLLKEKINKQKEKLLHYNQLKILFSGDSDSLEEIVRYIFKDIGFSLIEPEEKRDDIIISFDDRVAVVEIKGVSKSAAEKHAAQLQKWVSNYHIEHENNPKGILLINTFKDVKLEDRNEEDFPAQMLPYAQQMQHCLVSGLQFICMYLDFKNNQLSQSEIINLLLNTVGPLKYTDDPLIYFTKSRDQE